MGAQPLHEPSDRLNPAQQLDNPVILMAKPLVNPLIEPQILLNLPKQVIQNRHQILDYQFDELHAELDEGENHVGLTIVGDDRRKHLQNGNDLFPRVQQFQAVSVTVIHFRERFAFSTSHRLIGTIFRQCRQNILQDEFENQFKHSENGRFIETGIGRFGITIMVFPGH